MKRVALLCLLLVTVVSFTVLPNSACCCVEAFFVSPSVDGVIESEIIKALDEAEATIDIAMFSFTDDDLGAAVIRAYDREVDIRVILEDGRKNEPGGEYNRLLDHGIAIECATAGAYFHHKFAVIDGSLTITGSYNWSASADEKNFENVVFIDCEEIAQAYTNEFDQFWKLFVELVSVTSPVKQGAEATVAIRTLPKAECSIRVRYKSGYSTAAGLYAKTADASGMVAWTWTVGVRTTPGTWPIYVTAEKNGETARLETTFVVE